MTPRAVVRYLLAPVLLVLGSGVAGGLLGALVALAAVVAVRCGVPARLMPLGGVAALVLSAGWWLVGNADQWGRITFSLVSANPGPGRAATVALVLLAVGVVLDTRRPPDLGDGPEPRERPRRHVDPPMSEETSDG